MSRVPYQPPTAVWGVVMPEAAAGYRKVRREESSEHEHRARVPRGSANERFQRQGSPPHGNGCRSNRPLSLAEKLLQVAGVVLSGEEALLFQEPQVEWDGGLDALQPVLP